MKGVHHGRLAVEQAYGYMVHDQIIYGIITTFNTFIFLKRESPGILYMSRLISNDSTTPTVMKLLYFFSHLCARDPIPVLETNHEGVKVHLRKADKDTSAAPKIPNPDNSTSATLRDRSLLPEGEYTADTPRRSPRRHIDQNFLLSDSLYLEINSQGKGAYLGCKGWRGTLSTGCTVFAKLWDGWKFSAHNCEHETAVYMILRDLWGTIVPEFLGCGYWGFCHILLLSYIEVSYPTFHVSIDVVLLIFSVQCCIKLNSIPRLQKMYSKHLESYMQGRYVMETFGLRISLCVQTIL